MSWRVAFYEGQRIGFEHNTTYITMTTVLTPTTAIPRFLLPRLSWTARAVRPTALSAPDSRRSKSSSACTSSTSAVLGSTLRQRSTLSWRTTSPTCLAGSLNARESHRTFSATAPQLKDHHFDTLKFVQRLKDEGFTEEQAEGMMRVLSDVIEER